MTESIRDYFRREKLRSNTRRGTGFEEQVEDFFRSKGFIVETTMLNRSFIRDRKTGGGRWITKRGDFFGVFDHIAIDPRRVLFIQSTIDRGAIREKMRKIDAAVGLPGRGREYVVATVGLASQFDFWTRFDHSWVEVPRNYYGR